MNAAAVLHELVTDKNNINHEPDPITCLDCNQNLVSWFWNIGRANRPGATQYFKPCWMNPKTCIECNARKKAKEKDDPSVRLKNSGIPDRYAISSYSPYYQKKDQSWDEFRAAIGCGQLGIPLVSRSEFETAISWQPDHGWMLIEGAAGRGKTALACAAVATLLMEPQGIGNAINAIYETEAGIYDAIRQSKHLDADQRNVAREARKCRILIIDDIGAPNDTPGWCKDALQAIIMDRYDRRLPTILTTNLNPDQLEKAYGERTVSRIIDSVGRMYMKLENPSWRNGLQKPERTRSNKNALEF